MSSEVIKENIEQFEIKLAEEKAKYNKLLDETVDLEKKKENLDLDLFNYKKDNFFLDEEVKKKQEEIKAIEIEVAAIEVELKVTLESRNKLELDIKDLKERLEGLIKRHEFIVKNYDFTINVKKLAKNTDDFNSLIKSNEAVNT